MGKPAPGGRANPRMGPDPGGGRSRPPGTPVEHPQLPPSRPACLVTGLGAVTPIGIGLHAFTASLRAGRSGVGLIERADPRIRSSVAATVPASAADFVPEPDVRRLPRVVPLALGAAREAVRMAGLDLGPDAPAQLTRSIGIILGTGAGGIDFTAQQADAVAHGGRASLWTLTNATHGNLAGELSIALGLRGPSLCVSTGCASSSDALGLALDLLRGDRPGSPDAYVVVGADAHVTWQALHSMELLKVVSVRDWTGDPAGAAAASRPFDRSRDGFILGEGAWAMVVERASSARRRGAEPIGAVLGYGVTCDAFHRVRPAPDMEESARAMRLSLDDAAIAPQQVDVVQYHGTATRLNDALETRAVRMAFGAHADHLRGSAIKSMIGHPQGACGLASAVAALASLAGLDAGAPFIPPTINLTDPDPDCDLDYTPLRAAPAPGPTVLVNCLAFGAKNSAVVLRALRGWS
jgi:3-oxoacyl-[acyl-carrier-protein] synthase II